MFLLNSQNTRVWEVGRPLFGLVSGLWWDFKIAKDLSVCCGLDRFVKISKEIKPMTFKPVIALKCILRS